MQCKEFNYSYRRKDGDNNEQIRKHDTSGAVGRNANR